MRALLNSEVIATPHHVKFPEHPLSSHKARSLAAFPSSAQELNSWQPRGSDEAELTEGPVLNERQQPKVRLGLLAEGFGPPGLSTSTSAAQPLGYHLCFRSTFKGTEGQENTSRPKVQKVWGGGRG